MLMLESLPRSVVLKNLHACSYCMLMTLSPASVAEICCDSSACAYACDHFYHLCHS